MDRTRYAVFCDLDGTLLGGSGEVTDDTPNALRRFKSANVIIGKNDEEGVARYLLSLLDA